MPGGGSDELKIQDYKTQKSHICVERPWTRGLLTWGAYSRGIYQYILYLVFPMPMGTHNIGYEFRGTSD